MFVKYLSSFKFSSHSCRKLKTHESMRTLIFILCFNAPTFVHSTNLSHIVMQAPVLFWHSVLIFCSCKPNRAQMLLRHKNTFLKLFYARVFFQYKSLLFCFAFVSVNVKKCTSIIYENKIVWFDFSIRNNFSTMISLVNY